MKHIEKIDLNKLKEHKLMVWKFYEAMYMFNCSLQMRGGTMGPEKNFWKNNGYFSKSDEK